MKTVCVILSLVGLALAGNVKFTDIRFEEDGNSTEYFNLSPNETETLEYKFIGEYENVTTSNKVGFSVGDNLLATVRIGHSTPEFPDGSVLNRTMIYFIASNTSATLTFKDEELTDLAPELDGAYTMSLWTDEEMDAESEALPINAIVYCSGRNYIPVGFDIDEDNCQITFMSGCDEPLYHEYDIAESNLVSGVSNETTELEYTESEEENGFFRLFLNQQIPIEDFPKGNITWEVMSVQGERSGNISTLLSRFDTKACSNFIPYCTGQDVNLPPLAPMTSGDLDSNLECTVSANSEEEEVPGSCRGPELRSSDNNTVDVTFTCKSTCTMSWSLSSKELAYSCDEDLGLWVRTTETKDYPECDCPGDGASSVLASSSLLASVVALAIYNRL